MNISLQRYHSTGRYRNSLGRKLVSSRVLIPTLSILMIIIFACLHVWQRVHVLGLVQDVSALEKEREILNDLLKKTNTEIVDMSRLPRIEDMARGNLGLERTGTENLFTLKFKKEEIKPDALGDVMTSLRKLADNLPVINETKAADTVDLFEKNGY